jgi:lysophospholipase L1-like esterase
MILRQRLWILASAAIAIAGGCWWLNRTADFTNLPPRADGPWIAFGDSLTQGVGASEGNAYPAILSRSLGVPILNLGVSGDTTEGGLKRLDDLAEQRPRVALLCLGGNDSLQRVPHERTFANLAAMIDRFHVEGTFVVLIGVRSASLRDSNGKHFARLAREKRVLYVPDILRGLAFKPIYMSDAIHPNDEGYKRIAARLEKALRPLLPQLTSAASSQ